MVDLNKYKVRKELEEILRGLKINLMTSEHEVLREGIRANIADIEQRLENLEKET